MTKPKKRRDPEKHIPSGRPNKRTLAQFRREVVALLKAGHRVPSETAVRLVAKHHTFVADAWAGRRAPCWVSDNLSEKLKGHRHARDMAARRTGRDPEDPEPGEVYQSKTTGNIWEVTSFNRDRRRVKVKRTGMKDLGELTWNPVVLRGMKQLQTRIAAEVRTGPHDDGPNVPSQEENPGAFKRWLSSFKNSRRPKGEQLGLVGIRDLDGAARRYYVYVIESIQGGERVLYVGQSAHKPALRLLQHKRGAAYCKGCTKRSYAKGQQMRLVPEFYKGIPTIRSRQQAEKVERILARKLRSFGFTVEGGH